MRQIGLLQKQISRLNIRALFYRQGIDNAVEGRANVGFQECSLCCLICGLRFRSLGLHLGGFRLGIAVLLLLLEQGHVCLRTPQCIFRLLDFARGRRALLLQTVESFDIALCRVALAAGFDELGIKRQKFFVSAASCQVALVSLRRGHLRPRLRGLLADIGVVKLQQQLSLAYAVTFLH